MVKMTCSFLNHQSDFSLNYEKCIYHEEVDLVSMLRREKKIESRDKISTVSSELFLFILNYIINKQRVFFF